MDWEYLRHGLLVELSYNGRWQKAGGPGKLALRRDDGFGLHFADPPSPVSAAALQPYASRYHPALVVWVQPADHWLRTSALTSLRYPGPPLSWVQKPTVRSAVFDMGTQALELPDDLTMDDLVEAAGRCRQQEVTLDLTARPMHDAFAATFILIVGQAQRDGADNVRFDTTGPGLRVQLEVGGERRDMMHNVAGRGETAIVAALDDVCYRGVLRTRNPSATLTLERETGSAVLKLA